MTGLPQTHEQRHVEQPLLKLAQSDAHAPIANAARHNSVDSLEIVNACLTQMEATVLGLKELRSYVGTEVGSYMLAIVIEETEAKIAEIKQHITQ